MKSWQWLRQERERWNPEQANGEAVAEGNRGWTSTRNQPPLGNELSVVLKCAHAQRLCVADSAEPIVALVVLQPQDARTAAHLCGGDTLIIYCSKIKDIYYTFVEVTNSVLALDELNSDTLLSIILHKDAPAYCACVFGNIPHVRMRISAYYLTSDKIPIMITKNRCIKPSKMKTWLIEIHKSICIHTSKTYKSPKNDFSYNYQGAADTSDVFVPLPGNCCCWAGFGGGCKYWTPCCRWRRCSCCLC